LRISASPQLKKVTLVWLVFMGVMVADTAQLPAQNRPTSSHQVKAVFLYNFAQFVEWPTSAFPEPDSPLVIGVLGDDPFHSLLDEIVKNEKINGHPMVVQRYSTVEDVKGCHILFINTKKANQLESVIETLGERNILTVGDGSTFTEHGGMIGFITENNKVRLQVNLDVVKESNLTISSKLLRLANIVSH
jgi:hypothetical protein